MADVFDVLIVGGGAAGYTAGLFAARDRCRALLIEKFTAGGQVLNCEHITNFPGFPQGVAGYTLGPALQEQATAAGLQVAMNEVTAVRRADDLLQVDTDGGSHVGRALIVASGSRFTTLGVPGEEAFVGRGLSHCASCDGSFFMQKPVVVVGGGDAAVDEALHLTQYASSITVVHRRDTLRACASLQERGRREGKISFRWNTVVRAIEGGDGVERVQVADVGTGRNATIPASGVFIYAGLTPNTGFLGCLAPLDARGQIVTDRWMRTRVPGLLAAGDVRAESARQLVTAAGDGATAALAAVRYLRDGHWPAEA
ncbi:MAG TPA: FAD-dependent oxidoreductase [Methylomirabilota bacterium]|jgi:thioredoxin reductase (NADPH)|nr:FAD-dependent oxidoreductase [Methylomirabilota bacterium]